jgi:hypothetical protein
LEVFVLRHIEANDEGTNASQHSEYRDDNPADLIGRDQVIHELLGQEMARQFELGAMGL